MSDLKRCPFCGSSQLAITGGTHEDSTKQLQSWEIHCRNCWAIGPKLINYSSEIVEAQWNHRALIDPKPEAGEQ